MNSKNQRSRSIIVMSILLCVLIIAYLFVDKTEQLSMYIAIGALVVLVPLIMQLFRIKRWDRMNEPDAK